MIKGYSLPPELDNEINRLEELIAGYKRGEASATELKAHRVPFGVYEQREQGTYMARIRCAAGMVTPRNLEKVADIASRYGVSDLHITSRQELQIHYLKLEDIITVLRELKAIGLATRGGGGNTVRNISAQEDAGIDPDELFDVSPYALALTSRLIAEEDSWSLPRKFKIAFSGSGQDKGYATLADVGFIARIKDGQKGFRVYAAGGLGAKPATGKQLLDFIEADEAYPVARALKTVFWKYGNRKNKHAARLRFLWQALGEEEFKKKFHEEYALLKQAGSLPLAIEEAGDERGASKLTAQEAVSEREFVLWKKRFAKEQKQEGLFSVLVPVELGFISCACAGKLGNFLAAFGEDTLRLTKDQNILLRNIPRQYLGNVFNFLKADLPNALKPEIYGRILSCAGASTCQLGICLTRQAARALMQVLAKSALDLDRVGYIKLNISGCPNSCGQHQAADLGFSGKALRKEERLYPAYNVFAAAKVSDGGAKLAEQVGEVAAKDLPALVKDLLAAYLSKAGRYNNFQEYIAGEGKEELRGICLRYKDIPSFKQDKNYYFDWGSDNAFSLAQRGQGECSAGLFDLIEADLKNIKETRKKLSAADRGGEQRQQLLRGLIFYSSRMLLITRGLEPKSEEELYAAFSEQFIEKGLVDSRFKTIISLARKKDYSALLEKEEDAKRLAEEVEVLYQNMDNAFNFKTAVSASGSPGKAADTRALVKDFRGVACPMNFVKTKIELAKLKPGELLEIWLDDGPPIENVPGSVRAEGHQVIAQKKTGNYWSVLIKKS